MNRRGFIKLVIAASVVARVPYIAAEAKGEVYVRVVSSTGETLKTFGVDLDDAVAGIQSALDYSQPGQIVNLDPGAYKFKSNLVLKSYSQLEGGGCAKIEFIGAGGLIIEP